MQYYKRLEIFIFDASGRIVQQCKYDRILSGRYTYQLNRLTPGSYVAKIVTPYETFNRQVIIR